MERLLSDNWVVVSIDLQPLEQTHLNLTSVQGDIRCTEDLDRAFCQGPVDVVFHCAAQLAHGVDDKFLWSCNVDGTRRIAEYAGRFNVRKVIYTSSNCLWGESLGRPVSEDDEPHPVELYGVTKWEGEKILLEHSGDFETVVLRCPTIMDAGRLGLLTLLFEFIDEGRRVWVVGDGDNRYQFIYAQDLIDAMLLAAAYSGTEVFGIGSDNPSSLKAVYEYVIHSTGSRSRVASLPKRTTLAAMKIAYKLHVSPLGPYHYKMICEDFAFDTRRIKSKLKWRPTLTNEEMLLRAYDYYHRHREEINARNSASAHRKPSKMGVIRVLKWVS